MSNFILKEATLGEFRGNGSRGLDAAALSSSAFGVALLAEAQRNLQLNWPVMRGWDFVSRVVSTTKKKMTRAPEASLHGHTEGLAHSPRRRQLPGDGGWLTLEPRFGRGAFSKGVFPSATKQLMSMVKSLRPFLAWLLVIRLAFSKKYLQTLGMSRHSYFKLQ